MPVFSSIGGVATRAFGHNRQVKTIRVTEVSQTLTQVFNSSGTWTPFPNTISTIEYLIVAGGGGGGGGEIGGGDAGGGGGAGGYKTGTITINNSLSYPITVGAGGSGVNYLQFARGGNGTSSSFGNAATSPAFITTVGGGGGGRTPGEGLNGGSGGASSGSAALNGLGTPGEGNDGSRGVFVGGQGTFGGGGGGAGIAGNAFVNSSITRLESKGGNGLASTITGTSVFRAGGGAGGFEGFEGYSPFAPWSRLSLGGQGGGGRGGTRVYFDPNGQSGTVNTGGGGGGAACGPYDSGSSGGGGSGVVIVKFTQVGTIATEIIPNN